MGTLQFILLASAVVALIVWAIDIPTAKWEGFRARPRHKRTLLSILEATRTTTEEEGHDEAKPPARTYTEAVERMHRREEARSKRPTRRGHTS